MIFSHFSVPLRRKNTRMRVAVVNYHAGNVYSVMNALKRMGVEPILTDDATMLQAADKIVFPGQGEAAQAMSHLHEKGLDVVIPQLHVPLLGICIGQQLLCEHSEEGNLDCLGIFPTQVHHFVASTHQDKVPHMGWNTLHLPEQTLSPLFKGVEQESYVYFIHSYYVPVCDATIAETHFIHPFSAALQKDNFYAVQFHPEKSGAVGQRIIQNFLEL